MEIFRSKQEIIDSLISIQSDTDMLSESIPKEFRDRIITKTMAKMEIRRQELNSLPEASLAYEFRKQNRNARLHKITENRYQIIFI